VRSRLHGLVRSSSRLKWTDPCRRIKLVLHLRVTVLGAAHEGRAANDLPSRVLGNDFFAPESILRGNNHPVIKMIADRSDRLRHLRCFRRYNSQIAIRKLVRPGGRLERYMKVVPTRDRQSFAIQRTRMLLAPHEAPHLGNPRQVSRVEAPDSTATDYANSFH